MNSVYGLQCCTNVSCHQAHPVFGGRGTSLRLGGGTECAESRAPGCSPPGPPAEAVEDIRRSFLNCVLI